MISRQWIKVSLAIVMAAAAFAPPASADDLDFQLLAKGGKGGSGGSGGTTSPTYYSWMSPDVQGAWGDGYLGQGVTMTFVDDFTSRSRLFGNLGDGITRMRHGEWTSTEGSMIAPSATIVKDDFYSEDPIALAANKFNVVNLSYGFVDPAANYTDGWASAYPQEESIIEAATTGAALIAKSAGNSGVAVGTPDSDGVLDYLGKGLIGTQSTIFVGALDSNGTTSNKASLASYSNYAGSDADVQSHFLVVGVESGMTGLAGTSFAAPIVAGYGAILSNKFPGASPTQVADKLLSTARRDTVVDYNASIYGMGEASLANALAPQTVN